MVHNRTWCVLIRPWPSHDVSMNRCNHMEWLCMMLLPRDQRVKDLHHIHLNTRSWPERAQVADVVFTLGVLWTP